MAVMASVVDQFPTEAKSLKPEGSVDMDVPASINMNGTSGHSDVPPLSNGDAMQDLQDPPIVNGKSESSTDPLALPVSIPEPPAFIEQPISAPAIVEQPISDIRDLPADLPSPSRDLEMADAPAELVSEEVSVTVEVKEPSSISPALPAPLPQESAIIPPVEVEESAEIQESIDESATGPEPVVIEKSVSEVRVEPVTVEPEATVDSQPSPNPEALKALELTELDTPMADAPIESSTAAPSEPPAITSTVATPSAESIAGQVRLREDEMEEEPLAKRPKVEDDTIPPVSVPSAETPIPSTETPAPATIEADAPGAATPTDKEDFDSNPLSPSQVKYLTEQLRKAKKVKAAIPFLNPVDPVALNIPLYPQYIKNPMDLSTIENKLKNGQYTSANNFWSDFKLLAFNATTFNGPAHPVAVNAMNLEAYFKKLMVGIPKGDEEVKPKKTTPIPRPPPPRRESRHAAAAAAAPPPPPTPIKKASPSLPKLKDEHKPQLDQNGMPIIRRDSTIDRPKRDIVKPQRDLPYNTPKPKKKKTIAELKFCDYVNKELFKPKYYKFTYPFDSPVDPVALNIPDYLTLIKKPMDFGTMGTKLARNEYDSAKDYHKDAKLVFENCYKFNPPMDNVYKMGKQSEEAFDELWSKKDEWMSQNAPTSEPASDAEGEDEEDDDDETDAGAATDQMQRLLEIQKQIAALSSEAMSLSTAPQLPAGVKKSKKSKSAGAGEKPKKRSSLPGAVSSKSATSGAAASSSTKLKKPAKVKKLSLEDKRYVSEGIAQLDEPSMRKAVQIIRNGVPALKDVHDDELELDVDEIPEAVLQDLHRFVKAHRKAVGADITADDEDYEEPSIRRSSGAGGASKPAATQRKKNKPMSAREQESKIEQVRKQLQKFEGGEDEDADGTMETSEDEESSSSEEE